MTKTLEDNVAAIASIGDTIEERGFSDKLLASIFDFNDGSIANYLIYNYKLDKFYPLYLLMNNKNEGITIKS